MLFVGRIEGCPGGIQQKYGHRSIEALAGKIAKTEVEMIKSGRVFFN
jgi:hypothetical protein